MSESVTLMNPPKAAAERLVIETRLKQAFAGLQSDLGAVKPVGARAYTTGNDVFFAPGAYDPNSAAGKQLLGHELTHVTQQTGGAR